ncbi:MAG: hypothetical protein LJF15_01520 [Acidobacteria bacterium]|nr:hypothetical protein [Acidobacteriota bacterium]
MRRILRRHIPAILLAAAGLFAALPAEPSDLIDLSSPPEPPPIFKEYRYRMSAAIRPLLFWIGDGDVGGARIVWRRGEDGRRGYEFLLGSDPDRAPRRINRWGFVREELNGRRATQIGLMRKTDEESVEEARAKVGYEGEYVFKVIQTEVAGSEARAENTVWLVRDDYTYYDLGEVLSLVTKPPPSPPSVNEASLPPGTHPGFLFAVADIVDRAVTAATRDPRELLGKTTTRFNFNAVAYELRVRKTKWEESKEYGGRRYENLVRIDLESYNPTLDTTERFTLVCGTEGEWRGVPVYVKYQPKWWFKAEGVIDDSQVFERPASASTQPEGPTARPN